MLIRTVPASLQYISSCSDLHIAFRGRFTSSLRLPRSLQQKSRFPPNLPTMAHFTRRMSSHHKETKPDEKHPKFGNLPLSTSGPQDCAVTGTALLNTPYLNKGAGFPPEERKTFKLTGLLPQNVQTLDQQVKRAYQQYSTRVDDLAKNTFMTSLAYQNEVLYYRVSVTALEYLCTTVLFQIK
jgi:hypothetical protein